MLVRHVVPSSSVSFRTQCKASVPTMVGFSVGTTIWQTHVVWISVRSRNHQIINLRKKWGFRRFQKEAQNVCKTARTEVHNICPHKFKFATLQGIHTPKHRQKRRIFARSCAWKMLVLDTSSSRVFLCDIDHHDFRSGLSGRITRAMLWTSKIQICNCTLDELPKLFCFSCRLSFLQDTGICIGSSNYFFVWC